MNKHRIAKLARTKLEAKTLSKEEAQKIADRLGITLSPEYGKEQDTDHIPEDEHPWAKDARKGKELAQAETELPVGNANKDVKN